MVPLFIRKGFGGGAAPQPPGLTQGWCLTAGRLSARITQAHWRSFPQSLHVSWCLECMASLGAFRTSSTSSDVFVGVNNLYVTEITTSIEEHQRCFRLGSYFMAAVCAAASYYRGGFSLCLAGIHKTPHIYENMVIWPHDSTKDTRWKHSGKSATAPCEIFSSPIDMHRHTRIL